MAKKRKRIDEPNSNENQNLITETTTKKTKRKANQPAKATKTTKTTNTTTEKKTKKRKKPEEPTITTTEATSTDNTSTADKTTDKATEKTSNETTNTAENTAEKLAAEKTTNGTTDKAAEKTSNATTDKAAEKTTNGTTNTTENTVEKPAEKTTNAITNTTTSTTTKKKRRRRKIGDLPCFRLGTDSLTRRDPRKKNRYYSYLEQVPKEIFLFIISFISGARPSNLLSLRSCNHYLYSLLKPFFIPAFLVKKEHNVLEPKSIKCLFQRGRDSFINIEKVVFPINYDGFVFRILRALPCTVTDIDLSTVKLGIEGELKHLPSTIKSLSFLMINGRELQWSKLPELEKLVCILRDDVIPSYHFPPSIKDLLMKKDEQTPKDPQLGPLPSLPNLQNLKLLNLGTLSKPFVEKLPTSLSAIHLDLTDFNAKLELIPPNVTYLAMLRQKRTEGLTGDNFFTSLKSFSIGLKELPQSADPERFSQFLSLIPATIDYLRLEFLALKEVPLQIHLSNFKNLKTLILKSCGLNKSEVDFLKLQTKARIHYFDL